MRQVKGITRDVPETVEENLKVIVFYFNAFSCSSRLKGQDFRQAREITLQPSAQMDRAPVSRLASVLVVITVTMIVM